MISLPVSPRRVIVVTGAARGVGESLIREICIEYIGESVAIGLVDKDNLESLLKLKLLCENHGFTSEARIVDVRDSPSIKSFIMEFQERNGEITLLIANAGESPLIGTEFSIESTRQMMETNFFGAINTIYPVIQLRNNLIERDLKVVTISSISSLVSTHNSGAYSASKAALSKSIESLTLKYNKSGVTFLNIILGFVDTRATKGLPHAKYLNISAKKAAKKILKAIRSKKSSASIPVLRNLPWYLMRNIPTSIRIQLLQMVYTLFSRLDKDVQRDSKDRTI